MKRMKAEELIRQPCYMSSTEAHHLVHVRTVYGIRQVQLGDRVDCLLAWVDPGISVTSPSLTLLNLQTVVLASRLKELPLIPVREWPIPVFVHQLVFPTNGRSLFSSEESSQIGWAELFPTSAEAGGHVTTTLKLRLAAQLEQVASGELSAQSVIDEIASSYSVLDWDRTPLKGIFEALHHFNSDEDIRATDSAYARFEVDDLRRRTKMLLAAID